MSEDVKRVTKTDALVAHIEGLGTDKATFLPLGIRTKDLAEATGVPAASISVLLLPHVKSGRIQMCRVAIPGSPPQNEYRKGIGVAAPDFRPLNAKRAGIALPAVSPGRVMSDAESNRSIGRLKSLTPLSTPKPAVTAICTPTFLKSTQPEVVAPAAEKTPAADVPPPIRTAPAVAAQATPKPTVGAVLKKEPATRKASAGDVRIGINDAGTLVIALDDDSIELNPKQARKLGHFMSDTAGVWNPF